MENFDTLSVRPYQLMCIICKIGEGAVDDMGDDRLTAILRTVRENPNIPLTLRCNVESVSRYQNPGRDEDTPEGDLYNDKRDPSSIQKMGLVPGSTRPAREMLQRLFENVPTAEGLCGYGKVTSDTWKGCPRASSGCYEKGHAKGVGAVIPPRAEEEKAQAKTESAKACYETVPLHIRPHHLMCMACFHGGKTDLAPIAEDNLFEAIDVMQTNPDIPVTLVAGCCMICPPCTQYEPATNLCISNAGMALRDQKKDLDLLQHLDLKYGDTLPARELYTRLFESIHDSTQICGYGAAIIRAREWNICRGPEGSEPYRKARAAGMGFL